MCEVDPSKMGVLSLYIEKLKLASKCKMTVKSSPKETITVTSKSELAFQDCLPEDVRISATRVIGKYRCDCLAEASLGLENKP